MKTCNLASATPYTEMIKFNYSAPAELFGSPGRQRRSVTYRRFASGAEAVRFAVEGISEGLLAGVTLQADDDRFDHRAIRALYDSTSYPLTRKRGRAKKEGLHLVQSPAGVSRTEQTATVTGEVS
jgi:hypothetical protein